MDPKFNSRLRPRHGCLIVAAIFLLSFVLMSRGCAKTIVRWSVKYSDPAPTMFYPPHGSDQEIDGALEKAGQLTDYLNFGKSPPSVSFSADELNLLVYYHPSVEALADQVLVDIRDDILRVLGVLKIIPLDKLAERVRFDIHGDLLVIQGSLPLDKLAKAGLDTVSGRFLNAEVTLDLSVVGGNLLLFVRDIKVSGNSLPESFIKTFDKENLADTLSNNPKGAGLLSLLRNVHITDGKIFIAP